jgi:hypothetical protein
MGDSDYHFELDLFSSLAQEELCVEACCCLVEALGFLGEVSDDGGNGRCLVVMGQVCGGLERCVVAGATDSYHSH